MADASQVALQGDEALHPADRRQLQEERKGVLSGVHHGIAHQTSSQSG